MNLRLPLLSLCLFSFLSTPAFASAQAGSATLSIDGGYMFFSPKRHLHNTALIGGALGYNFDERWGIELAADVLNANSGLPGRNHVHGFLFMLDGLYRLCPQPYFEPYILAGFGVMGLKPSGTESIQQGNINAGVGVELFKSRGVALSAEARDIYTFVYGKNDILLNFGVNFIWE